LICTQVRKNFTYSCGARKKIYYSHLTDINIFILACWSTNKTEIDMKIYLNVTPLQQV